MRYILGVVALLEAWDVTNNGRHLGRHLGFYQELEIRLKPREMVNFLCFTWKMSKNYFYCGKKLKKKCIFTQNWHDHLLLMTSYLVSIKTDHL